MKDTEVVLIARVTENSEDAAMLKVGESDWEGVSGK